MRREDRPRGKKRKKKGTHTYIMHADKACICNGRAEDTNLNVTGSWRMEVSVQGKEEVELSLCVLMPGCVLEEHRLMKKEACYHMLDSQMGRCWVLSDWFYVF